MMTLVGQKKVSYKQTKLYCGMDPRYIVIASYFKTLRGRVRRVKVCVCLEGGTRRGRPSYKNPPENVNRTRRFV